MNILYQVTHRKGAISSFFDRDDAVFVVQLEFPPNPWTFRIAKLFAFFIDAKQLPVLALPDVESLSFP